MSDWENSGKIIEKILDIDCPSCGSRLHYSADHKMLSCDHCGYKEDFNKDNDHIVEIKLDQALSGLGYYIPENEDRKIYDCKGCSAKFSLDSSQTRVICAFCGSENVNLEAYDHKYVRPSGILPFQVSKKKAEEEFKNWIKRGWFHPKKLKKLAEIDSLHGVYIPFWTFDAQTKNQWSGEAGYYYYETVRVQINGQWQTKQVQKVRWVAKSGSFDHFFDDVVVSASHNLEQSFLNRILPFNLKELVNFDGRLMVSWESEIYSVELNEGWTKGEALMDSQLRMMAMQALGGDTQRGLVLRSQKDAQTYKHIILPIWLASYRFTNKIFRFVINGQTGKVYGQKPIAWWKIILLVMVFVAIIAGIYFLREMNNS
jgi:DNA-directed RNA polymerase subunit RPC12/RpoP